MSSGFSKSDIDSFFETDGVGVATRIELVDSSGAQVMTDDDPPVAAYDKTINTRFREEGKDIDVYSETGVSTSEPSFLCKQTAAADFPDTSSGQWLRVTFPGVESHEEGYGKTYRIEPRILAEGVQSARVYLKKL
jgi:hypothetical protein